MTWCLHVTASWSTQHREDVQHQYPFPYSYMISACPHLTILHNQVVQVRRADVEEMIETSGLKNIWACCDADVMPYRVLLFGICRGPPPSCWTKLSKVQVQCNRPRGLAQEPFESPVQKSKFRNHQHTETTKGTARCHDHGTPSRSPNQR